jgi:hypothetical protein
MNATLNGGVPPMDSSRPDVNTVPSGMIWPFQPSKSHTGEASLPERNVPRGSAQASPKPGGVSVPLVTKIARGASNEVVECASTSSNSTFVGMSVPGFNGPAYLRMLPLTQ